MKLDSGSFHYLDISKMWEDKCRISAIYPERLYSRHRQLAFRLSCCWNSPLLRVFGLPRYLISLSSSILCLLPRSRCLKEANSLRMLIAIAGTVIQRRHYLPLVVYYLFCVVFILPSGLCMVQCENLAVAFKVVPHF